MSQKEHDFGREFALLEDVARLLRKHGSETFEALAAMLDDPVRLRYVAAVLHAGASSAARVSAEPKRDRLRRVAAKLATGTTAEERTLFALAHELDTGVLEPSLRDVRRAAEVAALPAPHAKRRRDALGELIENLLKLPSADLERAVRSVRSALAPSERSLAGWDDLIERSRSETRE